MVKNSRAYTVMVADDEPEVVDLVHMVLRMEGYAVVHAKDGPTTIDLVKKAPPDLILLDVRMPKMSGLDVLEKLGADPVAASIPVVMLSVVTTYPEVRMALERGAVAYLAKPFELRKMVHLIARILRMDSQEREAYRQQALGTVGAKW